jgi:hypothetical protein
LAEENLVGCGLSYSGTRQFVEDVQQDPGAQGGRAREASQLGNAGGGITQQDTEESASGGQADALGLGGGCESSLQVGTDQDTAALGVLEGLDALSQSGELFVEVGESLLVRGGVEVTQGAAGLAVEALAGDAALLGVVGDVAASSEEDGAGAGESLERRYDTHG